VFDPSGSRLDVPRLAPVAMVLPGRDDEAILARDLTAGIGARAHCKEESDEG
jgi:hypothetical protein